MQILRCSLAAFLTLFNTAFATERVAVLDSCTSVSDCFDLLDPFIPEDEKGVYGADIDEIRNILKNRFGDQAKLALLEKAENDLGGWQNFATAILGDWGGWTEDDIPKLASILERKHGGWIARALGEIGSPEAIEVLVGDLPLAGFESQTGWALFGVGPQVLDYVLVVFTGPDVEDLADEIIVVGGGRQSAADLVKEFRSRAIVIADEWLSIARNDREDPTLRIAALRGLAAMGGYLDEKSSQIREIRNDRNLEVASEAFLTLVATRDPSVVEEFAASCEPSGSRWAEHVWKSFECLQTLSEFGTKGASITDNLQRFLTAENSPEQLYAIETLGLLGKTEAVPEIEKFLESHDWRKVYASVKALGQLQSRASVAKIEAATQNHWLWELRLYGESIAKQLIHHQPFVETYTDPSRVLIFSRFADYDFLTDITEKCEKAVWSHDHKPLTLEKRGFGKTHEIEFEDGIIIGTDEGEFGGALVWQPTVGEETTIVGHNVLFIFANGNDLIAIHGLSHISVNYGFAALVARDDNGTWAAKEIARFPASVRQARQLNDGKVVANALGRMIVFDKTGIEKTLPCY